MPISLPNETDTLQLAKQWKLADELVAEYGDGAVLNQTMDDLVTIQAVLDKGVLEGDKSYELQCLGIAFGRVLALNVAGLDWAIVEFKGGRDLAVRYRDTKLCFPARTIISRTVTAGGKVNLAEVYEGLVTKLEELKAQ